MNNITWKEAIFYVKWKVLSKTHSGLHYETHIPFLKRYNLKTHQNSKSVFTPNVISLPKVGSEQWVLLGQ